jgi:hypothetical protein
MSKFCPNCGNEETDDQSIFCRQCGGRFPQDPPKKKGGGHKVTGEDSQSTAGSTSVVPEGMVLKHAQRKRGKFARFLTFDIFITKPAISVIYSTGAVAITVVSVLYLVLGMVKPGMLPVLPTQNPLMLTPLFWILLLVFGNLFWRIFCELLVILFTVNQSLVSIGSTLIALNPAVIESDDAIENDDASDYTTCPLCSEPVPNDELQKCDRCGVFGCKNCIRTVGFMHKTKTCKTCFEKK